MATKTLVIEELDTQAATDTLNELQGLLDGAYHNSHMFRDLAEDLEERPDPFRLFLATVETRPVGVAVVERKFHQNYDYLGLSPVHVKRFTVANSMRGLGIGRRLLDVSKTYAFDELGLDVLFGESNEYGALALYGREGAYYRRETIEKYLRRNDPAAQALLYFALDISDSRFRERRYPNGDGIHFAFPADETAARFLKGGGFISQAEVLSTIDQTSL